jgi:hypothetical protein
MRPLPRIVVPLLLGAVLVGCTKPRSTAPKAEEEIKPVATLTADKLIGEYRSNEVGADQKYKDKPIQITGKVSGIKKAPLMGYYIGLGTAQEGEAFDIMCFLDMTDKPTADKAGQLKEGDTVTLIGKCEGRAAGLALYVRHCFFK